MAIKLTAIHYTRRKRLTLTPQRLPRMQIGRVQTHDREVHRGFVPATDSPDTVISTTTPWPATAAQLPKTSAGA